ncbi:alpha/beta hydrolase [Paraglaciecola aquimarina]|uniref:Alpha/beta hydrolase n=1 Tax=Paraglaciecola algarum TaxID=3050085 RepID=A0ABS9D146_9ALTE|nr:alpha/beta hydrolase [Paraglaciecola sp. G1-23]MCF2946651.1 alpha/beta hydrolase [Paraglaciecola sp. G1-23]
MHNLFTRFLVSSLFCCFSYCSYAEITDTKVIDNGGSGKYKAIVSSDSLLPGYVIYQPKNLQETLQSEQRLPAIIFANGACSDSSLEYERMLTEIASHGYLVITLGSIQKVKDDRPFKNVTNAMMGKALDWLSETSEDKDSRYYHAVDLNKIGFAGHSCGGAQLLAMASDSRVKTYLMFNSGIGDMSMAQADRSSLASLHGPTIYLVGGDSDVATPNAKLDYQRIDHVPVVLANDLDGGHSGTFNQPRGGSFASLALKWLDWQLKEQDTYAPIFLAGKLDNFAGWSVKGKQFEGIK